MVSVAARAVPTPPGRGGRIVIINKIVPTFAPNLTMETVDQEAAVEVGVDMVVVDTNAVVEVAVTAAAAATIVRDPLKVKVEVRVEANTSQVSPPVNNYQGVYHISHQGRPQGQGGGGAQFYQGRNTNQHHFDA